ncbi:MAG: GTP-binding protein [Promethearchaeota archaeon]|nr:MAG: GTP-binding protein [Candidatus Lokiarchaeota archaeon]
MNPDFVFKLITAGQGGVGKTTMLHRYIEGTFLYDTKMTIGVEIFNKEFQHRGADISLQLWDFGGQERFRFFLDSFVMGAAGAFLMFDLTRFDSLEGLHDWIGIVRKDNPTLPLVLLGSKYDLIENSHGMVIPEESIKYFMDQYNIRSFLRVSAKSGLNVEEAFGTLVDQIIEAKGLSLPTSIQAVE